MAFPPTGKPTHAQQPASALSAQDSQTYCALCHPGRVGNEDLQSGSANAHGGESAERSAFKFVCAHGRVGNVVVLASRDGKP